MKRKRMKLGWMLVSAWLVLSGVGTAQVVTTTVSDTVYHADGTPAQGVLLISWPQFTTVTGARVGAGSTTATLNPRGQLSVMLAPNSGSNPIGSYYTVVYRLDDGTLTRENWMVPASSVPVSLAAVRSTVLPTSVAMQTVTKAYVDSVIASTLAMNSILPAASLQTALAASPFLMTVSGCEDAHGDGTEGVLFESAGADGTPTCNGFFTTDGAGVLYGYDAAGHRTLSLDALTGAASVSTIAGGEGGAFTLSASSASNGNLALDGRGTGGIFLNFDDGTGGVKFGDGAGVVKVAIDSSGNIVANGNMTLGGRVAAQQSTPGSSSATCISGQIWTDASYIYVCTAMNTIMRATLNSF